MAATQKPRDPLSSDLNTWLTRNEASDLLGCSTQTIVKWERKGLLHPRKATRESAGIMREMILYDPRELARMPRKHAAPLSPGDLESRAFEMFDRGKDVRQVVIDLRVTSKEAWEIRERWVDATAPARATIEIDGDAHAKHSNAEIEDGIRAAIDDADDKAAKP